MSRSDMRGGIDVYYEVHRAPKEGRAPLVLLHGGLVAFDVSFGGMLPRLAQDRMVIAIEQQGHGRTADCDAPLPRSARRDRRGEPRGLHRQRPARGLCEHRAEPGGVAGTRGAGQAARLRFPGVRPEEIASIEAASFLYAAR